MSESDLKSMLDLLHEVSAEIREIRRELKAYRAELQEQATMIVRHLESPELRRALREHGPGSDAASWRHVERWLDVLIALVAPTLPEAARRLLAGEGGEH